MKFDIEPYADEHNLMMRDLRSIPIPGSTGGMTNYPGLFIYSVARATEAKKILEVGTRNGISAATFCRAMNKTHGEGVLISVDVVDVEKGEARPGVNGEKFPLVPSRMIEKIGDGNIKTHFIKDRGANVLREVPPGSLDIVLLDGSHTEKDVYEEIPLALAALKVGGVLLMDDIYPEGQSLRSHNKVIPGPWLAIKRLIDEEVIEGYVHPQPDYSVGYIEKVECLL